MTVDLHNDFKIERPPKDFYQVLVVDDEPNRLREAILRLERLAAMLERLRAKASGKTQLLIKKLEVEAGEVVNLLVGGSAPSRKGSS